MKSTLPSTKWTLLKQKIDLTETRFPRAGEAGRAWKQIHRCSNTKLEPHYFVLILDTNLAWPPYSYHCSNYCCCHWSKIWDLGWRQNPLGFSLRPCWREALFGQIQPDPTLVVLEEWSNGAITQNWRKLWFYINLQSAMCSHNRITI